MSCCSNAPKYDLKLAASSEPLSHAGSDVSETQSELLLTLKGYSKETPKLNNTTTIHNQVNNCCTSLDRQMHMRTEQPGDTMSGTFSHVFTG